MKYAVVRNNYFTGTVYEAAPDNVVAHHARFGESLKPVFGLKNIGTEEEPQWEEITSDLESAYKLVKQARKEAYSKISDSLFFEYQRGDATEAEWLAAVQSVKDAYPYPSLPKEEEETTEGES